MIVVSCSAAGAALSQSIFADAEDGADDDADSSVAQGLLADGSAAGTANVATGIDNNRTKKLIISIL